MDKYMNKIALEQNHETTLSEKVKPPLTEDPKSGIVMPADYSPHQKFVLEDYEVTASTKRKLQDLFVK